MLGEARNLEDIKSVRDKADAVRQYANSAHLGLRTQNYAAEIKLLAERRAGEMLSRMHLNGGYRRSASDSRGTGLKELGITANESARWQREASFSDAVFQRYLRETTRRGKELTSAGLLRAGARWESSLQPRKEGNALVSSLTASLRTMAGQQRTFGCIYALPPWAENRAKHYGAGTAFSKFAATAKWRTCHPARSATRGRSRAEPIVIDRPLRHLLQPRPFLAASARDSCKVFGT